MYLLVAILVIITSTYIAITLSQKKNSEKIEIVNPTKLDVKQLKEIIKAIQTSKSIKLDSTQVIQIIQQLKRKVRIVNKADKWRYLKICMSKKINFYELDDINKKSLPTAIKRAFSKILCISHPFGQSTNPRRKVPLFIINQLESNILT